MKDHGLDQRSEQSPSFQIQALQSEHASAIVDCFARVYGNNYANPLFYDSKALGGAIAAEEIYCIGAVAQDTVIAHMAMVRQHAKAIYPELGNTVVDPTARGGGLAWRVGAALTQWCRDLSFTGFLHYPTTAHHIMQEQSVKQGFETGLMLGYLPLDVDDKAIPTEMAPASQKPATLKQGAATVVFEPFDLPQPELPAYLPDEYADKIQSLAKACELPRQWQAAQPSAANIPPNTNVMELTNARRRLRRISVAKIGSDIETHLALHPDIHADTHACVQLDLRLNDPGLEFGVSKARAAGFVFCGWLPGYTDTDILRLQYINSDWVELKPHLTNPVARDILTHIHEELSCLP